MELRHLRYFKAVAEGMNFSRAAERLRVAQPALSRQIRALEAELGVTLLERERGVKFTEAGRVFYAQTVKILAQVDLAVAATHEAAKGVGTGELIVCNDWRLSGQLVPAVVADFHTAHPRAEVTLRDLKLHEQLAALRARRAHLGFVVRSLLDRRADLESLLVLRSRMRLVLPARHPLARRPLVRLAELAGESWVTLDEREAPGYRAYITQVTRLSGFTPRFGKAAMTFEGLLARVAMGYGVALTLEANAPVNNPLLRVVSTDVEPIELCAVWHRREKSPLLHAFLEIVRRHAAKKRPAADANGEP